MNCAKRTGVYAFLICMSALPQSNAAFAKDGKDQSIAVTNNVNLVAKPSEFRWNENHKLTWDDFRGPVRAENEESAAATFCGISFRTATDANGRQQVVVYNKFYTSRSWVQSDAKIPSILVHEQGHFDLCEIYTRKLRERMANFNFNVTDVQGSLMAIYGQVEKEYEARQASYEEQTAHGTIIPLQKKWQDAIDRELAGPGDQLALNK